MANQLLDEYAYFNRTPCDTEVSLQIMTPTQAIRIKTRLIGVDPYMSVILAMGCEPDWLAAKEYIREGQKVVVRLVNSDFPDAKIIAFQTQIQKLMSIAGRWLLLDYPKSIQEASLRLHSRLPIEADVQLVDRNTKKICSSGLLTDISINGGAFLGTPIEGEMIAQEYLLQVNIAGEQAAESMVVTVQNRKKVSNNNQLVQYGLHLDGQAEKSKSFVKHLVLHYLFD